jgi:hypothetical protein
VKGDGTTTEAAFVRKEEPNNRNDSGMEMDVGSTKRKESTSETV